MAAKSISRYRNQSCAGKYSVNDTCRNVLFGLAGVPGEAYQTGRAKYSGYVILFHYLKTCKHLPTKSACCLGSQRKPVLYSEFAPVSPEPNTSPTAEIFG